MNLYDYLKERGFKGLNITDVHHVTKQLLIALAFIKDEVSTAAMSSSILVGRRPHVSTNQLPSSLYVSETGPL